MTWYDSDLYKLFLKMPIGSAIYIPKRTKLKGYQKQNKGKKICK